MASLVAGSVAATTAEFRRLRGVAQLAQLDPHELLPSPVIISVASAAGSVLSVESTDAQANATGGVVTAAGGRGGDDVDDAPLAESERAELRRLEATLRDMSETRERVMAQNIALLADLEVAQRAVRELRADKDAMAVQLKRALMNAGRDE